MCKQIFLEPSPELWLNHSLCSNICLLPSPQGPRRLWATSAVAKLSKPVPTCQTARRVLKWISMCLNKSTTLCQEPDFNLDTTHGLYQSWYLILSRCICTVSLCVSFVVFPPAERSFASNQAILSSPFLKSTFASWCSSSIQIQISSQIKAQTTEAKLKPCESVCVYNHEKSQSWRHL